MRRCGALLLATLLAALPLAVEPAYGWLKSGGNMPRNPHRLKLLGGAADGFGAPASAAYSFRLLKSSYAGKALQLRRASDNAVLDIGFTAGGDFDTAAATTHCNATTCQVEVWYDQSGNGRNATRQGSNSATVIFNCLGTKPCARYTTNLEYIKASVAAWAAGRTSLSAVANRSVGLGTCTFITKVSNALSSHTTANNWVVGDSVSNAFVLAATDTAWHAGIGVIDGAASLGRIDGTEIAGANTTGNAAGSDLTIGQGVAGTTCSQVEQIIWDNYALTAAERTALTTNQQQYWMPYALDTFATPAAAYSLRKLKSTYSGPAVQLRRASDNAVLDINFLGFVPGLGSPLDVAAANAHCAATSCFVAKWYDQSGNVRDAVQATAGNQPAFIFGCQGTLPCARLTAANQYVGTANVTPATGTMSLSVVANRRIGTGKCYWLTEDSLNIFTSQDTVANTWQLSDNTLAFSGVAADAAWHAGAAVINGASSVVRIDGTETTGSVTGKTTAGQIFVIAAFSGSGNTCDQTEAILWDNYALTAAERAALTANQRSFWGF